MNTQIKTIISTICLALVCACARGQVAIYKNNLRLTRTGGGTTTKSKVEGFTVIDQSLGEVVRIEVNTLSKNFQAFTNNDYTVNSVQGSSQKEYSVIARADTFNDDSGNLVQVSETLKGQNVLLNIKQAGIEGWSIPKALEYSARAVYASSAGDITLDETNGVLTYDSSATRQANTSAPDLDDAVDAIITHLTNLGYTQVLMPAARSK